MNKVLNIGERHKEKEIALLEKSVLEEIEEYLESNKLLKNCKNETILKVAEFLKDTVEERKGEL